MTIRFLLAALVVSSCPGKIAVAQEHPLSAEKQTELRKSFERIVAETSAEIEKAPDNVRHYSRRGDAHFFLGHFQRAVADYEKMALLDPSLEKSHWRRGIAYFYHDQYKQAAHQFEIYDTFDQVDRENGIWRFFSQTKAHGRKKARAGLLKYQKDDREPFPAVYKLFSAQITPGEILKQIAAADIDETEREKRLFYAHLYIGLNYAVEDKQQPAIGHLRKAVANTWGPKAGFGPSYMWHVGRLHYQLLTNAKK